MINHKNNSSFLQPKTLILALKLCIYLAAITEFRQKYVSKSLVTKEQCYLNHKKKVTAIKISSSCLLSDPLFIVLVTWNIPSKQIKKFYHS